MKENLLTAGSRQRTWSDFAGLLQLMWGRFGTLIVRLLIIAVAGVGLTWATRGVLDEGQMSRIATMWVIALTQVPLTLVCMFGLDWSTGDLDGRSSAVDPFLIRSPISSRLLVVVPLLCKSTSVALALALIFGCLSPAARSSGMKISVVVWMTLTSIAIWTSAIVWRPYRREWGRLASVLILGITGYGLIFFVLTTDRDPSWSWLRLAGIPLPVLAVLVVGLWTALDSMRLARTNHRGREADGRSWLTAIDGWGVNHGDVPRPLRTELRWFDRMRVGPLAHMLLILVATVLSIALVTTKQVSFSLVAYSVLTITMAHAIAFGGWADLRSGTMASNRRRTPNLLAVSPISMHILSYEKAIGCVIRTTLIAIWIGLPIMISALLFGHQQFWWAWASNITVQGSDVTSTGLRATIVIGLLTYLAIVGTTLGNLWTNLLANDRLVTAVTIAMSFIMGGFLVWGLFWISRQSEWQDLLDMRDRWLMRVPTIIGVLAIIKLACVGPATWLAARQPGRASDTWIAGTFSLWAVVVIVAAGLAVSMLPAMVPCSITSASWLTSPPQWLIVCSIAVLTPLSRVLILPWAMAGDIHR
ncbi:MAG: hypothetical protein AAGC97_14010 [Planctomycetota bacterium]